MLLKNKSATPVMTKGILIGILAALLLAALTVIPLVRYNHQRVNTIRTNQSAQLLTSEQSAQATQLATDFFRALGNGDWVKVSNLCPPGFALGDRIDQPIKDYVTGATLVSLGQPFTESYYPGVFVPYEIRFKNAAVRKYRLAVRRDNAKRKWYFDGGL